MVDTQFIINILIGILFLIIYGWLIHIENYLRSKKYVKDEQEGTK